jgi:8-amino-7-oxononanoate synthase
MQLRMESPVGPRVIFNGREYDYFSGTGYLGLQNHPEVVQAGVDALRRYGLSTATSRGGLGEHPVYDELEKEGCAYFDAQKMLYFPSGYMGAAVLTQATGRNYDHIFIDAWAHFSLWEAAQATSKPITPFQHLRPDALADALRRELQAGERPLVLSDGVFPISGEIVPLPAFLTIIKPYNGLVYLDDAHAVGVLGENGRGTADFYGIQDEALRTSATLAKALGGYGGVIWGEAGWIDFIEQNSAICVGASPPPLVVAAASARALKVARTHPDLRKNLKENVTLARGGVKTLGWDLDDSPVPIICLAARENINLEHIKNGLFEQGIAVTVVRSYTSTPPGGAIRIAIFADHSAAQIQRLVAEIGKLV